MKERSVTPSSSSEKEIAKAKRIADTVQELARTTRARYEFILSRWGVSSEEATKTVERWIDASDKFDAKTWTNRSIKVLPPGGPENIIGCFLDDERFCAPKIAEEALFALFWNDIDLLAKWVNRLPGIRNRFDQDPRGFWMRLGEYCGRKATGAGWLDHLPAWLAFAMENWIETDTSKRKKFPPVCLWTRGSYQFFLKNVPKADALRKALENNCLYRPYGVAYAFNGTVWNRISRERKRQGTKKV